MGLAFGIIFFSDHTFCFSLLHKHECYCSLQLHSKLNWFCRSRGTCLDGQKKWYMQIIMNVPWQMVYLVSNEEQSLEWWFTCFHWVVEIPRPKATMDGEQGSPPSGAVMAQVWDSFAGFNFPFHDNLNCIRLFFPFGLDSHLMICFSFLCGYDSKLLCHYAFRVYFLLVSLMLYKSLPLLRSCDSSFFMIL